MKVSVSDDCPHCRRPLFYFEPEGIIACDRCHWCAPFSEPLIAEGREAICRVAAAQLVASDVGRDTLSRLLDWLNTTGLSLDQSNKQAVLALLNAAWNDIPGTARDIMGEALR